MNNYFPSFSPVSFGPDINTADCECLGQPFKQKVQTSDVTRFQLPNNCPETWGSNMMANGDFAAGLVGWFQGNGNGASFEWVINSGKARGFPTSMILNQPLPISQFQKYKLSLDVTLGSGCTIYVVGFRDDDSDSSDYVILATITSTGTQTITFTPEEDFVRIGFILVGDCANSDLDNITLQLASYDCLDLCIYDTDDILIANVPSASISYYGAFIYVQVDWAALGITQGCYKICICNTNDVVYATNLWTIGDDGTFESGITGCTSDETPSQSSTKAYQGIYSFKIRQDNTVPTVVIKNTDDLTLKRNTRYRLSARVYVDGTYNPSSSNARMAWRNPSLTGFSDATTHDSNTLSVDSSADMQHWKEMYIEFSTNNSDNVGDLELQLTGNDWTTIFLLGVNIYVDNVILYETESYSTCSQAFELSDEYTCTFLLEWYNDEPAFGFYYNGDSSIRHSLRVEGKFRNPVFNGDKETFKDTAGTRKIVYAEKEEKKQLILKELPAYLHEAIAVGLDHDHFLVDGVEYVSKEGDYTPNWRKSSNLAPVIIDLVKKEQGDMRNSYC